MREDIGQIRLTSRGWNEEEDENKNDDRFEHSISIESEKKNFDIFFVVVFFS